MAGPWRTAREAATMGAMILLILAVIGLAGLPFALAVIHAESVSAWLAALPQRLRGRGWGLLLLLLPAAGACAMHDRFDLRAAIPETLFAAVLLVYLPRLARQAVPFALLLLAGYLFVRLLRSYRGDNVMRGFMNQPLVNTWSGYLVPAVLGLLAAALWLAVLVDAPGAGMVSALAARWRGSARAGIHPAQAWLLPPVFVLAMELPGSGNRWLTLPLTAAAATTCLVLVFRTRVWAATLAEAGLLVLGGYGIAIATFWHALPGHWYAVAPVDQARVVFGGFGEGTVLLAVGLWLAPRVMGEHRGKPELAEQAQRLTQRVQALTQTRSDALDTAAAELSRIERDLHDGAQARLVAVGMALQAAERLFPRNPRAALALVTEAKQSSSRALAELRDLVRGIYPPVLADRGLADAVRALARGGPTIVVIEVPCALSSPKISTC